MPRAIICGNDDVLPSYARAALVNADRLTILTGQSGITLVKVVPVSESFDRARRDRAATSGRPGAGGCIGQGGVDVAEDETQARDPGREVGQPAPGQRPLLVVVEPEAPQQGRAVDHGQARIGGRRDVALVDRERALGPAALKL